MQDDKLLHCPFCGLESARAITKERLFFGQNEFAVKKIDVVGYVKCNKCHARGGTVSAILYKNTKNYFDDIAKLKEEAIKTWNTRKPMERIVEQLEEQRKEYTELTKIPSMGLPQQSFYSGLARGFELSQDYVRNGGKEQP